MTNAPSNIPANRTVDTAPSKQDASSSIALNLCDVLDPMAMDCARADAQPSRTLERLCERACWQAGALQVSRLYVGSYFCERYFLACGAHLFDAVAGFARQRGLPVTLVLPVFGQATLQAGTALASSVLDKHAVASGIDEPGGTNGLGSPIDEVCVNDYGMAAWLAGAGSPAPQVRLVWGRLFNRSTRDPRYQAFGTRPHAFGIDAHEAKRLVDTFGVSMLEADPITPEVDLSPLRDMLPVALHLSHCFASTGRMCLFASQHKPVAQKFRPGAACRLECQQAINVYETFDGDRMPLPGEHEQPHAAQGLQPAPTVFTRHGRTVYFENPGCALVGGLAARVVWTPDDFCCPNVWPAPGIPYPPAYNQLPAQNAQPVYPGVADAAPASPHLSGYWPAAYVEAGGEVQGVLDTGGLPWA